LLSLFLINSPDGFPWPYWLLYAVLFKLHRKKSLAGQYKAAALRFRILRLQREEVRIIEAF
ncbi:hypothetical protein, partial [Paenibacillus sp. MY03]|uniref:hypothetical protein n=1 Tax=Paenibacillus sp. MY03 TaxID=302980 RepID=UPI001C4FBA25